MLRWRKEGETSDAPCFPPLVNDVLFDLVHPLVDVEHGEVRDNHRDHDRDRLDDPRLLQAVCQTQYVSRARQPHRCQHLALHGDALTPLTVVRLRDTDVHDCKLLREPYDGRSEERPHGHPKRREDGCQHCPAPVHPASAYAHQYPETEKRKEEGKGNERTMPWDGAEAHDDGDPESALAHDLHEQRVLELRLLHLLRARPAHVLERPSCFMST